VILRDLIVDQKLKHKGKPEDCEEVGGLRTVAAMLPNVCAACSRLAREEGGRNVREFGGTMQAFQNSLKTASGVVMLFLLQFAIVGFLMAPAMQAQTDTGRISGTVVDSSGASIPGAAITVVNLANNATQTVTSGGAGDFTVSALPPGNYKATVTMQGFANQTVTFKLDVSQDQAINFTLSVGSATTTVEVTGAVPLVQTVSSETGLVINDRQLSDLPLNGRNFTQLALLTPGVTRGEYGNTASGVGSNVETLRYNDTGGASLAANGLRPQANNFLLDGLDNNEAMVNTIVFFPPVEAMSEFRVTNSLAPAEFGRAGGIITQSDIKAGTNQIHGSAFMFYRDSVLGGANENYFNPSLPEADYHRNQFGGTIGGPILKDKLFLFADYQGLREAIPNGGATINTVPTAAMRTGDFSELLGTHLTSVPYNGLGSFAPDGCATFTTVHGYVVSQTSDTNNPNDMTALNNTPDNGAIFDPLTCAQFGTAAAPNIIPTNRLNSVAVKYLNAFPLPNRAGVTSPINNYAHQQFINNKYNDFDVRLDWHPESRDVLFVRYSYGQDNDTKTISVEGVPSGFAAGDNNTHPRGVAAGDTHIFTQNIVNEFRFGYTRPYYGYLPPFNGDAFSANLGIPNANRNSNLGGGALIGGNNTNLSYTGDGGAYAVPQHSYQFVDSLSYNHGKHAFKFGGQVLFRHVDFEQGNDAKGFFQYQGTGSDYTGWDTAEMLAGFVNTYSIATGAGFYNTRTYETGYFAEDDWKITHRLTLNLGLRYDLYNFPYETQNRESNFNIATGTLELAGQNGNSRSLINTPKTNFAPRVGFAYDMFGDGKTALRGGYGIYYFLDRGGVGNELSNNPDFNGIASYDDYTGYRIALSGQTATLQPNTSTPGPYPVNDSTTATNPLPLPTPGQGINPAAPTNAVVISYPLNSKLPMIQQYNLALQQQIASNTTVTIAYVGTKADHLFSPTTYSNPQLGTGIKFFQGQGLTVNENLFEGTSHYNGLQTSLNRRLMNGFNLTAAYTWSHNTDDSASPFAINEAAVPVTAAGPQLSLARGNADDDQRHAFTASALIELPYGRGKRYGANINRGLDYLVGGWQFSPFVQIGSGTPFDLTVNAGSSAQGPGNRPDLVGNPDIGLRKDYANVTNGFSYLNQSAFVNPPVNSAGVYYRVGTVHRNEFYGPGYNTTGLSLFKDIPFTERINSQIRAQCYNLFNHPQFAQPSNGTSGSGTDLDTSSIVVDSTRFRSARELELAYRITF
jgi:hypothetical protein